MLQKGISMSVAMPVAAVSVVFKPMATGLHKNIQKQVDGESIGEDIADEITKPIKKKVPKETKDATKEATEEVKKGFKNPLKGVKMKLGNGFKKMGKQAGQTFKNNFGSVLKGGALFAGTAIVAGGGLLLKDSIAEASSLQQSMGGLDAVFGESSAAMHQFSKEAAQSLGLSKNEYNEMATLMGTQLKVGGLDGSDLTSEVQNLGTLGADLGSMFGTSTEQATNAISALLRGESEAIRQYGVSIDQTAVQNKALEMGLVSQGEEMSASAKQQATLALLYEQTGDAQGNFARESETLAGKQAQAAASFNNVKASIGEALLPAMTGLFDFINAKIIPAVEDLVSWIKVDLIPALSSMAQWIDKNSAWLGPLAVGIGVVVAAVGLIVAGTWLWATAQGALNIALLTSPITWVIIGIVALVAALVLAYNKSETFRNIVNGVWAAIKTAIGAVVNWIVTYVWPVIQTAWNAIATAALWLYHNAILPAWNAIRAAISATVSWVMNVAVPWLQQAWAAISSAAMWLWNNVMKPVWNGIKIAIAVAVGFIMTYIDLLKWYFSKVIAPIALWLYNNVMKPVWNGIKSAIGAVVAWFRDTAWPILSSVISWIRTKFEQFKTGLGIIWAFIKNNVINPVIAWFRDVVWPLISTIIGWIRTKFDTFKNNLNIIWQFIKNTVINPVIAWFRDVVWPLISRVINLIKEKFENFKNNLNRIWKFVKNDVINPVITWIEDKVLGRITAFVDKAKEAFTSMKDGIGEAFDLIKDKVRGPIEWLIDTVVNDSIIDNINSVLTTFGMEDKHIGEVSLPKGFATGGYTGPGSKYQPAGVVHADEYVIRKESQNSLRKAAPGFLDSLNRFGARALDGMGYGYAGGGWVKPFQGSYSQNSGFRSAHRPGHDGVDYPTPSGTPVVAVTDGTIKSARRGPIAGKKIELSTALAGVVAGYHHLSEMLVSAGDSVTAGQTLGYTGNTGRSSGPHLHFSIRRDGSYVDPNPYLQGAGAAGTGEGGFNPFAGLWDGLKGKISDHVGDSVFGNLLGGFPKFIIDKGIDWAKDALTFWDGNHDPEGGAEQWRDLGRSALKREGQFSRANLDSMIRRINQESSGDPRAVNTWDVNAQNGDPSKGLLQTIGSTFQAYRDKSLANDVFDPLANMVASIRYTLANYGSLQAGWDRSGGYADGGLVEPLLHDSGGYLQPGLSVLANKTRRPEPVLTSAQWDDMHRIAQNAQVGRDVEINQYINSASATANEIASGVSWELRRKGITNRR